MTLVQRIRSALAAGVKLPDTPLVRRLLLASADMRRERPPVTNGVPHQGARECARRCRRMARAALGADGEGSGPR